MIQRKKKICKSCGKERYIFSHGNCSYCASKVPKKKPASSYKKIGDLEKILDSLFSKYVRQKASVNGYLNCYICNNIIRYADAELMHYIPRKNKALRYDEMNCKAGCIVCNQYKGGNLIKYREKLVKEYGEDLVVQLEMTKSKISDREELLTLIEYYKKQVI